MDTSMRSVGTSSTSSLTMSGTTTVDNPRQLQQGEGTSSRLSGARDSLELDAGPRNVKPLRYDADDVRVAVGSGKSLGRLKNWLADKLPFVGKTTYGTILQKADAYSANAAGRSVPERAGDLRSLLAAIATWQNVHGTASAKGQAIEQLRQSVMAAVTGVADQSRAAVMQEVENEFDVLCGRAPDPKSGQQSSATVLSSKLIFRGNTEAAKALTAHLQRSVPPSYLDAVRGKTDELIKGFDPGKRHVEFDSDKGKAATTIRDFTDDAFSEVTDLGDEMMTFLMGGTDADAIGDAADALPQEVIDTLAALDERVAADSNDDPATRRLAVASTLFLRFATKVMTDGADLSVAQDNRSPRDTGKAALSALVQSAINNSPDDRQVTSAVRDGLKTDYLAFVRKYDQPMTEFVDAVLARAGRPPL